MFTFSFSANFNGFCNPFMSYNPRLNFFLGMAGGFAGLPMPFMPNYFSSLFYNSNCLGMATNFPMMQMPVMPPPVMAMPMQQTMQIPFASQTMPALMSMEMPIAPMPTFNNMFIPPKISKPTENEEVKPPKKVTPPNNNTYNSNALPDIAKSDLMSNVSPKLKSQILDCVDRACKQYDVDPKLVIALMSVESSFNPKATSNFVKKDGSIGHARGLMQLTDPTAKEYGVPDPYNVEQNIFAGVKVLKNLLKRYNGNKDLAIAAYNIGPAKVKDHVPDVKETKEHVARVNLRYQSLC